MATKKCPYCAEEIQEEAIKCRYCGSDLNGLLKPKAWRYMTLIFHFRCMDEVGWLNAENTSAAMAAQHFWNELHRTLISELDEESLKKGWEIVEPHGPGCLKIESTRNAKGQNSLLIGLSAVLTGGVSLIGNAIGFYKWWPSSLTLRYRMPDESEQNDIIDLWMNPKNNYEWEEIESKSNNCENCFEFAIED